MEGMFVPRGFQSTAAQTQKGRDAAWLLQQEASSTEPEFINTGHLIEAN